MDLRPTLTKFILGMLILTGLVFRAWPVVNDCPIWLDESFTFRDLQTRQWYLFLCGQAHEDHPSLSYILVAISRYLFGTSNTWSLRLPSLICGTVCIPVAFRLGSKLQSQGLGLCLAALMTFAPTAIDQSQQARMYSLYLLILLIILVVSVDVFRSEKPGRSRLIKLGVWLGLIGWTHQLMIPVWIAFMIALSYHVWQSGVGASLQDRRRDIIAINYQVFLVASLVNLPNLIQLLLRLTRERNSGLSVPEMIFSISECLQIILGTGLLGLCVCVMVVWGLWQLSTCINRSFGVLAASLAVTTILIQIPLANHHIQIATRYLLAILPIIHLGLSVHVVSKESHRVLRIASLLLLSCFLSHTASKSWETTFVKSSTKYASGAGARFIVENRLENEYVVSFPDYHAWLPKFYHSLQKSPEPLLEPFVENSHEYCRPSDQPCTGVWVLINCWNLSERGEYRKFRAAIRKISPRLGTSFTLDQIARLYKRGFIVVHIGQTTTEAWQFKAIGRSQFEAFPLPIRKRLKSYQDTPVSRSAAKNSRL